MKRLIIHLMIASLLFQIGCSGVSQISLPIDTNQNDIEIRSLNYFGERLTSTIYLTNLVEVEAYWLKMKDDKIYFLTEGLDDTTSIGIYKIKTVRFYDMYGGCMRGGLLSLGFFVLTGVAFGSNGNSNKSTENNSLWALISFGFSIGVGVLGGILFFGHREFNFIQNN